MRRVISFVSLVVGISFIALPLAQAQVTFHGIPPSVTSVTPGRFGAPGVPAGINSFGGFVGSKGGFGGNVIIRDPRFDGRLSGFHGGFRGRGRFPVVVPVYVPVYGGYYGGYPLVYQPHSIDDPVVAPGGVVQYGTMSNSSRYEQPVYSQQQDDERYGEHYLDDREDSRRDEPRRRPRSEVAEEDQTASARVVRPEVMEAPPTKEPAKAQSSPDINVLLVYKDGRRREVHNYVIVGQTFWDLTDHLTRKIPLSDIDLDATTKVNDERGTPITLPKG